MTRTESNPASGSDEPASEQSSARRQSLWRNTSWNSVGQLAPRVAQVVLTPLLVGSLGLERYGLWASIWLVVTLLSSLDGGISSALGWMLVRSRVEGASDVFTRAIWTVALAYLAVAGLVTGLAVAGGPAVIGAMHLSPALTQEAMALRWLVGPLFFASMLGPVSSAIFIAHERFRFVGLSTVFRVLLSTGGAVTVVLFDLGVRGLVLTTIGAYTAAALLRLGWAFSTRMIRARPALLAGAQLREMLAYGWRMQVVSLTVIVNVQFDGFVLAALFPLEVVAVYAIAQNVAQSLRYLPMQALQPMFVRMTEIHHSQGPVAAATAYRAHQQVWMRYLTLYVAVWTIGLPFALERWLGDDAGNVGGLAVVVFAGYAINLFTGVTTSFARAIGRPGFETNYAMIATGVNVAATIPLAHLFGAHGIVGATALGSALGSLHLLRKVRGVSALPVRVFSGVSVRALSAALLGAGLGLPFVAGVVPTGTVGLGAVAVAAFGVIGLSAVAATPGRPAPT